MLHLWVGSDSSNLIKRLNTSQVKNHRNCTASNECKKENLQTKLTLSPPNNTVPSEIFQDQKIANIDAQKNELFNIYFLSVFTRNANVGKQNDKITFF